MSPASSSMPSPSQVFAILLHDPRRWLVPALTVAVLAGVYALVRPNTWEASQALILRNEAAASADTPGKFAHADEMKTVQETILELVKSRSVLAVALEKVGPPAEYTGPQTAWPRPKDVAHLREALELAPPKGAEFGKTEIFYLKVRDQDRQRAIRLVSAVSGELERRYQELRNAKAQSMINELVKAVKLAQDDLAVSTAQLRTIESEVGADLAELRILHESSSGESALRRTVTEITNELRQVETARKQNEQLLALLRQAQGEPDRLVAMPNSLLEAQPALRRLKDGLIDAKLRSAELMGQRSEQHPLVKAAREAEKEIGRHLHAELASAVGAIEVDLRLADHRKAVLEKQLAVTTEKLDGLAALRAEYSNLVSETRHRAALLEEAEQKLAEARITQATSEAASLIGRIDRPDTGANPVGPGRGTILLAGLAGGLATGLGIVFLTLPPSFPSSTPPIDPPEFVKPAHTNGHTNGSAHGRGLSLKQALERAAYRRRWK